MRPILIASLAIIPLILFYALRDVTGDPIIAVVFGLLFLVLVASWFSGRPAAHGGIRR